MNEFLRSLLFLPPQGSSYAYLVDRLHYFVILTTLVASTGVGLTAIVFFIRYRRRHEGQRTPHIETSKTAEALFIGLPLALFLAWFAIGYRDYVHLATPPPGAMDVYVMAKQWMWKFAYPEGPSSVSTLRVPRGRPVRLLMTSRDVIHSFYVAGFRLKRDVLPGRYTEIWFQAEKEGSYDILCAEYCGAGHSTMRGEVVVMPPQEFDDWMRDQQRGLPVVQDSQPTARETVPTLANMVEQGQKLAGVYGCFKCHTVDGTQHIGPTWLDLYGRHEKLSDGATQVVDEAYITESMMDPAVKIVAGYQNVMPSYQGKLSAPETAAIVEFIKSLHTESVAAAPSKGPVYEPAHR